MDQQKMVHNLIDKLVLDMLDLVEQQVKCKVDIEKRTNEGRLLLAKSRYVQGAQTVCAAQIPTENSAEFNALVRVKDVEGENLQQNKISLEVAKIDKDAGFVDPVKWFGVLVPRSLHLAKNKFTKSVELVVECANVQIQLQTTIAYIKKLTVSM